MNQIIKDIETPLIKKGLPQMNIGDTVKVFVKERTQGYEGVIIKRHGSGLNTTITVRRVFQGIGIERVFLVHSPRVEKITVQRRGHVRRAKLYYLRERTGKATRIKEKVGAAREAAAVAAVAPEEAAPAPVQPDAPKAPEAEAVAAPPETAATETAE